MYGNYELIHRAQILTISFLISLFGEARSETCKKYLTYDAEILDMKCSTLIEGLSSIKSYKEGRSIDLKTFRNNIVHADFELEDDQILINKKEKYCFDLKSLITAHEQWMFLETLPTIHMCICQTYSTIDYLWEIHRYKEENPILNS